MRIILCVVALSLALSGAAHAADLYVLDGASGTCTTNWSNACDQVTTALAAASRGDTIYVAEGTYTGFSMSEAVSSTTTISIKKATVADHGSATGWLDAYGDGQAIITSTVSVNTNYWIIDGNGSVPTNGTFTDGTYGFKWTLGGCCGTDQALRINSTSHHEFRHLEIDAATEANCRGAIYLYTGGTDVLFHNVQVYDVGDDPFTVHRYSDTTFEYMYVHSRSSASAASCAAGAPHADAMEMGDAPNGSSATKNVIRWSVFDWNGQVIWFGNSPIAGHGAWDIYGNVFKWSAGTTNNSNTGLKFRTDTSAGPIIGCNNTFVNLYNGHVSNGNITGIQQNNLYYALTSSVGGYGGMSHDYNWFHSTIASPPTEANRQLGTDPFVDYATEDVRLAAATNPGNPAGCPSGNAVDAFGNVRGEDGTFDRGAYEYGGGGGAVSPTVIITSPTTSSAYSTDATPLAAISGTVTGGTITGCTGLSSATGAFAITVTGSTFTANATHTLTTDDATTLEVECTNDDLLTGDDTLTVNHATPSGTLPGQDDFDRANAVDLGGSWTCQTTSCPTIASNQATGNGVSTRQHAFYAAVEVEPNQYSLWTLKTAPDSSSFQYVTVRAQDSGSASYDNYNMTAESGKSIFAKIINGTRTVLLTCPTDGIPAGCDSASAIPWAIDDVLRLEIEGDTLRGYRSGALVGTIASGGQLTTGSPGVGLWGSAAADDFEGGELGTTGTTNPTIAITTPDTSSTTAFSTSASTYSVSGTCAHPDGVSAVTWVNSAGGSGTATGTTSWSQASIALALGLNTLTFTCTSNEATTADATIDVTRTSVGDEKKRLRISGGD
jgi:hypothetical protein